MDLTISCKIDTRGLNKGLALASVYTKRTPDQVVNTAGLEIAYEAKFRMPFVKAQTIDTELGAGTVLQPRIRKDGTIRYLRSSKKRKLTGGRMGDPVEVPLTALIILARANVAGLNRGAGGGGVSNYNVSTGSRYALSGNPFKGVTRARGAADMAALVDAMLKGRRSSGNFLMAGWTECIEVMLPFSVNRWRRRSGAAAAPPGSNNYYGAHLGGAWPAVTGDTHAVCIIENNIGYVGKNALSFNRALWQYGAPVLQRAVDGEGVRAMNYALDKSFQELARDVNKIWA